METLIDSTVRVTIRHSDIEPIASVAATAFHNREEATGAGRPLKPRAPDDRFMTQIPSTRGESPVRPAKFAGVAGNIAAGGQRKWQNHGAKRGFARYPRSYPAILGVMPAIL
jgi:hypothetical protein